MKKLAFFIATGLSLLFLSRVALVRTPVYAETLTPQLSENGQTVISYILVTAQEIPPLSVLLTPAPGGEDFRFSTDFNDINPFNTSY